MRRSLGKERRITFVGRASCFLPRAHFGLRSSAYPNTDVAEPVFRSVERWDDARVIQEDEFSYKLEVLTKVK